MSINNIKLINFRELLNNIVRYITEKMTHKQPLFL